MNAALIVSGAIAVLAALVCFVLVAADTSRESFWRRLVVGAVVGYGGLAAVVAGVS